MIDAKRKLIVDIIEDILEVMGYTDLMGIVKMRVFDLTPEQVNNILKILKKYSNEVAQII